MKSFPVFYSLILLAGAGMLSAGQGGHGIEFLPSGPLVPAGNRITDEELAARQKAAAFGGFVAEDAPKRQTFKLEDMSEFLAYGEHSVLLPKGSVIHLPENHRSRKVAAIQGELIGWHDFAARYRALTVTIEITLNQAAGIETIDAEKLQPLREGGRIVVAVIHGNPVSVHPAAYAETSTH